MSCPGPLHFAHIADVYGISVICRRVLVFIYIYTYIYIYIFIYIYNYITDVDFFHRCSNGCCMGGSCRHGHVRRSPLQDGLADKYLVWQCCLVCRKYVAFYYDSRMPFCVFV